MTNTSSVYFDNNGNELVVDAGGVLTVLPGGTLNVKGGTLLNNSVGLVYRGLGNRMNCTPQGFSGGASWSQLARTRHYSNVPFRRFRVAIQTFYNTGTPIADADYPNSYDFQVGFEPNYVAGNSGIPARIPVTFNGASTASYSTAAPPATGYLLSDVIDLGYY